MSQVPTDAELQAQADAKGAVFVNESKLKASIAKVDFMVHPGSCLTICVITMLNGYTVTGESACADPKMYDAEIGQKFAFAAAERKMWPLLGYALRDELFKNGLLGYAQRDELFKKGLGSTFQDRVRDELKDLTDKIEKLSAFVGGHEHFLKLEAEDQNDLNDQLQAMKAYQFLLQKRISRF